MHRSINQSTNPARVMVCGNPVQPPLLPLQLLRCHHCTLQTAQHCIALSTACCDLKAVSLPAACPAAARHAAFLCSAAAAGVERRRRRRHRRCSCRATTACAALLQQTPATPSRQARASVHAAATTPGRLRPWCRWQRTSFHHSCSITPLLDQSINHSSFSCSQFPLPWWRWRSRRPG